MSSARMSGKVLFGPFELDGDSGELRKRGRKVRIPEQAIQILSMLVDQPAQIVTREEIRRRLWPGGTVVEFEYGINAAIKEASVGLGRLGGKTAVCRDHSAARLSSDCPDRTSAIRLATDTSSGPDLRLRTACGEPYWPAHLALSRPEHHRGWGYGTRVPG